MNKRILAIIFAATLMAPVVPAHAQFLKKLGNALDKVANAGNKESNDGLGRRLGKSIQIGSMTMSAYGDNPGVGFNFGKCYRKDGAVILTFQYPSQGQKDVENVGIRNYGDDATQVYGPAGVLYDISMIGFGERESSEGVSYNVPQGGFTNGYLVIKGVPESVASLSKVVFRSSGQYPMDAVVHRYAFVLENVTIEPEETPTQVNYTMPQGGWKLTSQGVGPVRIGESVSGLPSDVKGLYSKVRKEGTSLYFELDGNDVMYAETAGGKISMLQVSGDNIAIDVAGKTFRVGGDTDLLKTLQGVKGNSYNDDAEYQGIRISGYDSEIQNFTVGK